MLNLHVAVQAVVSADVRLMELRAEEAELNRRLGNLTVDGTDGELLRFFNSFIATNTPPPLTLFINFVVTNETHSARRQQGANWVCCCAHKGHYQ